MVIASQNIEQKAGYKQTEVGVIPEDWEVKKLGEVCTYQNGTSLENFFNEHQGLNVISIGNYSVDGKYIDTSSYIDWKHYNKIKRFILHNNELCMILNDKTAIGAIIGRVLLIEQNNKFVFNQRSMRLVPQDNISPNYLYHVINSDLLHSKIVSLAKPGTQIYVNTGDVTGLNVPVPNSLEEQMAICTVLSDIDLLIESLDQLIAKKRDIKQGTMQQLLTGKMRLPGFSGEWEVKRLEEIAEVDSDNLSSNTHLDYTFKYISLEDVDTGILRKYSEITFRDAPSRARRKVRRNDILFSTVRPNLKSHLHITVDTPDLICSTGFSVLRCYQTITNPSYVYFHLFAEEIGRQIESLLTGSNYPAINSNDVRSLRIPFPSLPEQQAIATVLSDMDTEIVALEQRRDKSRALKQGMMQELLTGKTRLL